jgi:hypothetical protein
VRRLSTLYTRYMPSAAPMGTNMMGYWVGWDSV